MIITVVFPEGGPLAGVIEVTKGARYWNRELKLLFF